MIEYIHGRVSRQRNDTANPSHSVQCRPTSLELTTNHPDFLANQFGCLAQGEVPKLHTPNDGDSDLLEKTYVTSKGIEAKGYLHGTLPLPHKPGLGDIR